MARRAVVHVGRHHVGPAICTRVRAVHRPAPPADPELFCPGLAVRERRSASADADDWPGGREQLDRVELVRTVEELAYGAGWKWDGYGDEGGSACQTMEGGVGGGAHDEHRLGS